MLSKNASPLLAKLDGSDDAVNVPTLGASVISPLNQVMR
jgi:hypothetical protein